MKEKKFLDEKTRPIFKLGFLLILVFFGFWYIDSVKGALITTYSVLRPIVYGLVIAFIINLPMNFFQEKLFNRFIDKDKHKKLVPVLSLILAWIIFFAIVTLILTVLIPELANAITSIIDNIPVFFDRLIEYLNDQRLFKEVSAEISAKINSLNVDNFTSELKRLLDGRNWGFVSKTSSILNSVSQTIMTIVMGFIFSLYVSLNKKDLQTNTNKILLANFKEEKVKQVNYIAKLSYDSFSRLLETRFLSCLSLGIICFIGMLILRLPMPAMISILVGALDIIPYFGPIIATAIGMILIFIQSPAQSLVFLIFVLAIQQFQESILYPLVIGKHQGLPAIWIFLSVFVGGGLFGIFGMLVSMPIATVIYTLVEDSTKRKLKTKEITEEDVRSLNEKSYESMREEKMDFKF